MKHRNTLPFLLSFLSCLALCLFTKADDPEVWWSLRPLKESALPADAKGAKNPIDRFILTKLKEQNLTPASPAEKRELLRRVYINLTGLPPTPEECQRFCADKSPDAYEKVVDQLLASPRYGERMARHWMDIVHFAESHGHDEDKHRTNAWPYRDYLIRSFNDDKPYVRFVEEQIAGDALYPGVAEGVVALGLLAAGPWDQSSQMGIQDGTLDKQIARYLDRDDMIQTVMSSFTSMTVHCARCHDHKFDPISMDDYYSLQAVFAGVERVDRDYDFDPKIALERRRLLRERSKEEKKDQNDPIWLSEAAQNQAAAWEKSQSRWKFVSPKELLSSDGASLSPLPDGSIRSGGKRPEAETVTVVSAPEMSRVSAIRLELLPDPELPQKGPGRQENGNCHLNEIHLLIQHGKAEKDDAFTEIKLTKASSDYDQPGWTAAMAIDGNAKTAWGIYPQVGKPHVAVFEPTEPVKLSKGDQLKIVLDQHHGGGHLIGRFRLSLSDSEKPETAQLRPKELVEALACDPAKRSESQRRLLARHATLAKFDEAIGHLPKPQRVYAIDSDFPADGNFKPPQGPRAVSVLRRGDIKQPMRAAHSGALSCIAAIPARFEITDEKDEAQRRIAMARWLTDKKNPLIWRSLANRLWQWNFGQGLVATPNDFGKMGAQPTHPELLDWLALQIRNGTSIKTLERMLVCSAAYQQSVSNTEAQKKDPTNRLLARMNRTRLDAETARDAILQISGKLDLSMYGPSIKQFQEKPGLHVTPVADYDHFDVDAPGSHRRSIYHFIFRTVPDPLMDLLDCPDSSQLSPKRSESSTALQALALLNHPFMLRMSEHLAERVQQEEKTRPRQIDRLYQLVLLRSPTLSELQKMDAFVGKHGLANSCRVLLNSDEFHFVD